MKAFVHRFADKILGVLSGFDRIRFRGSLRLLSNVGGVGAWLNSKGVLLKEFASFAEGLTNRLRKQTHELAEQAGRPVVYLDRFCNKEELVRKIRHEQVVADNGLITVLSTLETCWSYDIYRNRETKQIELRRRSRRGLRPFDPEDAAFLQVITRGEFTVSGFRNRDIRLALEGRWKMRMSRHAN